MKRKRKVKISASELTDVDVQHISLVRRPANRVPFSIMKAEQSTGGKMFDLSSVFTKKSDESPAAALAPVVTSIIVNGDVPEGLVDLLKAEGFDTDDVSQEAGITVFAQDVDYEGEDHVLKITDNIAMTVGVIKADGAFAIRCAERGFYPSISIATDLLQSELYRTIEKADSPTTASERIGTLVGEFGTYLSGLVGSLPSTVFKAEEAVAKMDTSKVAPPKTDAKPEGEADVSEAGAGAAAELAAKSEGDDDKDAKGDKELEAAPVDLKAILSEVTKSVTEALEPKFAELTGKVDEMGGKVDEAVETAKKAEKTVTNSVFGGVFGDDPEPEFEEVGKSEAGLPFLDTGFGKLGRTATAN